MTQCILVKKGRNLYASVLICCDENDEFQVFSESWKISLMKWCIENATNDGFGYFLQKPAAMMEHIFIIIGEI